MGELNQYALSKLLGSTMKPIKEVRFGNFGLLEATAEILRAREDSRGEHGGSGFTYAKDAVVVRAFEDVREGAAPDAILWNRELLDRFVNRCRQLGIDAPEAVLGRRLINVRKNIQRYRKHRITLGPTTKIEPQTSVVPTYAHVIEFALVRLKYRYGASIDDILLDPVLGEQFEALAHVVVPSLPSKELRLGALYIRKTRNLAKRQLAALKALDIHIVDEHATQSVPLSGIHEDEIPESPGLLELKEGSRYLYISRNDNLRRTVSQFARGTAFQIISNDFWRASLDEITLQYVEGRGIGGSSTTKWERRLIHDFEPIFNWPVRKNAA